MSQATDLSRANAMSIRNEAKAETRISNHEVEKQDSLSTSPNSRQPEAKPWQTKLLRLGPIAGLCALLLAVVSLLVALAILLGSRGEAKASWSIPPSSWLAICTAVANQALRFAAFQGVAIAWWFKALRGTTFGRLHYDWYSGTHVIGALTAGRSMGWIGLACIFSTLAAIDGPFMQRATTIVSSPISEVVPLNITLAPEISRQGTGGYVIANGTTQRSALAFNSSVPSSTGSVPNNVHAVTGPSWIEHIAQPYWEGVEFPLFVEGCRAGAHCKAKVKAPALAVTSCKTRETWLGWNTLFNSSTTLNSVLEAKHAPPIEQVPFMVQLVLVLGEKESIELVTAHAEMPDCRGTIRMRSCNLVSAVGEYDISVRGGKTTLDQPIQPRILATANNTAVSREFSRKWNFYPSTLAGIVHAISVKWGAYVTIFQDNGFPEYTVPANPQVAEDFIKLVPPDHCTSFRDPFDEVMQSMNELMFYNGVLDPTIYSYEKAAGHYEEVLDPGLEVNSTVTGQLDGVHEVYSTDLWYFLAAAVIEGISIALILPTYVGFWKLGRHVTFSPLEIAKAFEAPILDDYASNSSARSMAKALGDRTIQYGVRPEQGSQGVGRIVFGDPSDLESPQRGASLA